MSIQKVEMTVEQKENGQYVEQVVYPYVEYDHVAMENGMDIMSMIRDDVSTPMVTHNTTSWKVGQGDSDVSESIVDSSIASMAIKGQTYQNILPSPSLRNNMADGKTMQKLNEGYDSVNTVDGVCKSAILKGNTLVNLVKESSEIKIVGKASSTLAKYQVNHIDITKDYTVLFEINDFNGSGNISFSLGTQSKGISLEEVNHNGKFNILIPSSKIGSEMNEIWFYWTNGNWVDGNTATIKNIILIEGDYTNADIPYFEGMQSVKVPVLKAVGKNTLNPDEFEKDKLVQDSGNVISFSNTTLSGYAKVTKGESWTFSGNGSSGDYVCFYDNNKNFIKRVTGSSAKTFIPDIDGFVRVFQYTSPFENVKYQLEQNTVTTSYEPYKSNILTVNEEIELGAVGEVQDTLDLLTGEVIERTDEITLDVTNVRVATGDGSDRFEITSNIIPKNNQYIINDNSGINNWGLTVLNNYNYAKNNTITYHANSKKFFIRFESGLYTAESLKQKLIDTPLTLRYQLETESIKTVDLTILDQDNQPINQLNSFANGYIQVSSQEGTLIPTTEYEVPTSNSYHADLMKPNTQYTMKNMQGIFTIDNIQYNASANGTFTSPSTLTNKFMITSVAQSQPMLLEGDMTSEEVPYVEGIKSTFDGVDRVEIYSVGKNLLSSSFKLGWINTSDGSISSSTSKLATIDLIKVLPSTEYAITRGSGTRSIIAEFDNDENYLGYIGGDTFTTKSNTSKIRVFIDATTELIGHSLAIGSDNKTTYEPHKSNTTSFQLPHPLHSLPNGVRDEIILNRVNHKAKIVQRVGEDLTQLETPFITEVNLEGYPYVYKGGHIFLNTEVAPMTEVTYSINQAHQIESSNEDILRHQKEINHLYELIAQYVQVQYEAELIDIALQG